MSERRIDFNQEAAGRQPRGVMVNGEWREVDLSQFPDGHPFHELARPKDSVAARGSYRQPVTSSVGSYEQRKAFLEKAKYAERGAILLAQQATEKAESIKSKIQQQEDELAIRAFQELEAQGRDFPGQSDAWTPAQAALLNEQLQSDEIEGETPQALAMPATDQPFGSIIGSIGQPKERRMLSRKSKRQPLNGEVIVGSEKPGRGKKRVLVLGGVGLVFVGSATMVAVEMNKPAEDQVAKPTVTVAPAEAEAIAKKQNPDITPASIALGQCLADGSRLFGGHASGASSEAWVFKAADGTLKGAQTADGKYLPVTVQSAPFDAAACVPADARGAMVTIKDNTVTIDKSKVTPEVRMGAGGKVTPVEQVFAAAPSVGLTDDGAKALNAAQADKANKDSAATIAYANVARAITQAGSADLGRVEAQMDTGLLQSATDQITAFYKKQGRDAPAFNLSLTGDYLAPKVTDPASLPDILTKTKDIVRLTPATLTALDFNADPAATATPDPTGK